MNTMSAILNFICFTLSSDGNVLYTFIPAQP